MRRWRDGKHLRRLTTVRRAHERGRARRLRCESLEPRILLATGAEWSSASSDRPEGEGDSYDVELRLEATNLDGQSIDSLGIGQTALLTLWAQDLRPPSELSGVFAAYLDILFDASLIGPHTDTGNSLGFDIRFDEDYLNGLSGRAMDTGLLDEVGAFQSGYLPLGPAPQTVFQVPFTAASVTPADDVFAGIAEDAVDVLLDVLANDTIATGVADFSALPADVRPEHAVLLFDPPKLLPNSVVKYTGTQLRITRAGVGAIVSASEATAGGSVKITADGNHLLYSPAPDYHGKESFNYTVISGETARVTIQVDSVNDPPIAVADTYELLANETAAIPAGAGLLANDTDADHDRLTIQEYSQPAHGTVVTFIDGSFRYVPDPDYRGADQFSYVATDGVDVSQRTIVELEVGVPQANIRLALTDASGGPFDQWIEGTPLTLQAWVQDLRDAAHEPLGIAAAYLDIDYDGGSVAPIQDEQAALGFQVAFGPGFADPGTGNVHTMGLIDEIGSDRPMHDPTGSEPQLLFRLPLLSSGPHSADDEYAVSFESRHNVLDVLVNDQQLEWDMDFVPRSATDSPAHDTQFVQPSGVAISPLDVRFDATSVRVRNRADLTITSVGIPDHGGAVSIVADQRSVTYVPAAGFAGDESFTYTLNNSTGSMSTGVVTIHVIPTWHNLRHPTDVNDDGQVTPIDALIVINDLNQFGPRRLTAPPNGAPFLDVNDDAHVLPLDALLVINELNHQNAAGGEGEASLRACTLAALPLAFGRAQNRGPTVGSAHTDRLDDARTNATGPSVWPAAVPEFDPPIRPNGPTAFDNRRATTTKATDQNDALSDSTAIDALAELQTLPGDQRR